MPETWNNPDVLPVAAEGILNFRSVHVLAKVVGHNELVTVYYMFGKSKWYEATIPPKPVEVVQWCYAYYP